MSPKPAPAERSGLVTMTSLTHRESEVLSLAVEGLTNDEIGARLEISRRTVEAHMRTLFRKTGVNRRAELAALDEPDGAGLVGLSGPAAAVSDDRIVAPRRSRVDPAAQARSLQLYSAAIRRLVDRQFPLFEERAEITVIVGEKDGLDTVVERRWTVPKPYLIYRMLSPIVVWTDGPSVDPVDLALACHVYGQDISVDVQTVQEPDGRPLVMVLFQPGLQSQTEWVLQYRSPDLWNPLRRSGQDTLTWATATLDRRHQPTITELTVKILFPPGWSGEQVTERNKLGVFRIDQMPAGQTQVTWQDRAPVAAVYNWVLQGAPPS